MFGLLDKDIEYIKKAFEKFEEIERVIIFGSRAMGSYKKGSDVDIAVIGKRVSSSIILRLDEYLNEEYPLPYFFDIIHYNKIENKNLKHHIDTMGKEIFNKGTRHLI